MNTYDAEVFTYLTQPENYRAAKEITGQIGRVDQKLLHDFWEELVAKLSTELKDSQWQVDWDYSESWLSIHHADWQQLGINCDQLQGVPDLGIHAPKESYDRDTVNNLLAPLFSTIKGRLKSSDSWPYFNRLGFDFYQTATLESILPANREQSVIRASKTILSFFASFSALVERIAQEAKKH